VKKRIEFPLFELIVVIILLFVLAVFALPKFWDVGREARIKTLNAVALNLGTVNRLLYSRAVIKNVQNMALQSTDVLGGEETGVYLVYGELRAQPSDLKKYVTSPLITFSQMTKSGEVRFFLENYKNDACYISYREASLITDSDYKPSIKRAYYRIKSTGC
jgi:Tfp pilus assembly protein FimT